MSLLRGFLLNDRAVCDVSYYIVKDEGINCRDGINGNCQGKVKCNTNGVRVNNGHHSNGTAQGGGGECANASNGFGDGEDCFYEGQSEKWKVCSHYNRKLLAASVTTNKPTKAPTFKPTIRAPTDKPTRKSSLAPAARFQPSKPTERPTVPFGAPDPEGVALFGWAWWWPFTIAELQRPTTRKPTNFPTSRPTSPTRKPTTPRPTKKPSTLRPTKPTRTPTAKPTRTPTTHAPTTGVPTIHLTSHVLTFSGGNGKQLNVTLESSIRYNITHANAYPYFVFRTTFSVPAADLSSCFSFSVNGNRAGSVQYVYGQTAFGDIKYSDIFFLGPQVDVKVGDTVILNNGTCLSPSNYKYAPPLSGNYLTFITDSLGNTVSTLQ